MAQIDRDYHKLLNYVLLTGFKYEDPNRKGINRIQIPTYQLNYSFTDGFPAITTKKLQWRSVVGELLWFLRGDTNTKFLVDRDIHIWDKDAYNYYLKEGPIYNDKPISPKELSSKGYDLGKVYGFQWRNFGKNFWDSPKGIDQIDNLIQGLRNNPMGTQHIVNAWNPADLNEMALPPCHWSFEILPEPLGKDAKRGINDPLYKFTLKWHQRSVDTFLGLPFNIASYALLAHIIGTATNMIPLGIIGDLSNVHIYEPHMDAVKKQLNNDSFKYNAPSLKIDTVSVHMLENEIDNWGIGKVIENLDILNFELLDYNCYPPINAKMLAYNK